MARIKFDAVPNVPLAIIKLRGDLDLSQEKLADKMGAAQPTVWRWENGIDTPRLNTMHRLAMVFGMTTSEFIKYAEDLT